MGLFEAGLTLLFWPIPVAKLPDPMGCKPQIEPQKSIEAASGPVLTEKVEDKHLSRLLCLPVELFDEIARYLRPSSLVSLGLTCKDLWALGTKSALQNFSKSSSRWKSERIHLLSGLVRDSPDLILCSKCRILQSITRTAPMKGSPAKPRSRCTCFNSQLNICQHFKITRRSLELAVKRYTVLGHPDTRLTKLFRHSCKWRTAGSDSAEFALDVKSRMIEGEMYLKQSYNVDVKMDSRGTFQIPSMRGKGCLHTGIWLKKQCACSLRHASKKEHPCNRCLTVQPCAFCHTHFKVSSQLLEAENRYRLCVIAYRCLGAGQAGGNSASNKWKDQTTSLDAPHPARLWHPSPRPSLEYVFERKDRGRFEKHAYRQDFFSFTVDEYSWMFYKEFWQAPL